MKPIIDAIPADVLESELTPDTFVRATNFGGNHIHIVTHKNAPNVLREIGRLRELAFRTAGGGTGKDCDVDAYDLLPDKPYNQLVVWDPESREIQGGYRFMLCRNIGRDEKNRVKVATAGLLNLSEHFISTYLPHCIELGRSFVQPKFQSSVANRKAIFALDNLWDGLGAILLENPDMKYFFGKVTMYTSYNTDARNLILYFLKKHFPDNEGLMYPYEPLEPGYDEAKMSALFNSGNYKEDYRILSSAVRDLGENIPPLVNSYMSLSPTMKTFGTAVNHAFGGVEETGIMVTIDDIFPSKKERHLATYTPKGFKIQ